MSLVNVSEVISDPDFCQDFTVIRSVGGYFGAGGFVPGTPTEIPASGVIIPLTTKELMQVKEADRVKGTMNFYTTSDFPLYITRNVTGEQEISDRIVWKGENYKLIRVEPFSDYGFYQAVGVRDLGD